MRAAAGEHLPHRERRLTGRLEQVPRRLLGSGLQRDQERQQSPSPRGHGDPANRCSSRHQRPHRAFAGVPEVPAERPHRALLNGRHAQSLERDLRRVAERHLAALRIGRVGSAHHLEQRHQVLGAADQRTGLEHHAGIARRGREHAAVRNHAGRRLMAEHAAEQSWDPDRAADVGADPERGPAASDRGTLAARGTPGCARHVIRVVRAAVDMVRGFDPQRELGCVGDADRDRPRLHQPLHGGRGGAAPIGRPRHQPGRLWHPGDARSTPSR